MAQVQGGTIRKETLLPGQVVPRGRFLITQLVSTVKFLA
jgi:hypothetical protein